MDTVFSSPLPLGFLGPTSGLVFLVLAGCALLEGAVWSYRTPGSYDWRASTASLADALIRRGLDLALSLSLTTHLFLLAHQYRLQSIEMSGFWAFVLLFVGQEFCYYWFHRASHRTRWFWASHLVHHSPNQLSLATAMRLGWTGKLAGTGLFFTPLVWIGFPIQAVAAAIALNLLYQFWIHAPWIPKLGPLEWVLNTPTHHKVHHGSNPEYLDANYGGVLIIFDRLFGSFCEHREDIPIRYGLTEPLYSHNPIYIALHGWVELWKAQQPIQGTGAKLRFLLSPP